MHSEAVSGHLYIYLGLGIYGGGACLHSVHLAKVIFVFALAVALAGPSQP